MTSACIFGSVARNRVDELSDRDVLVTAASEREVTQAARDWRSAGWSVSTFTHQQMSNMANGGSLFLQHLKQEGNIVNDDNDFLKSAFCQFRPRGNYDSEIRDSLRLLRDIPYRPLAYWSAMCAADIAYVAIRNIAILSLASRGMYKFEYAELINYFGSESRISCARLNALLDLRILKHGYRNRLTTLFPLPVLREAIIAAEEIFGHLDSFFPQNADKRFGYRGLRMLEFDLVMIADPRDFDRLPAKDPLAEAWTFICNPRYPKPVKMVDRDWIGSIEQLAQARFKIRQ
jgi:hypothetical protein